METTIKIGKSVIHNFSNYAQKSSIDDVSEFFPVLKIIIRGVTNAYDGSNKDKGRIKKSLVHFSKRNDSLPSIKNC